MTGTLPEAPSRERRRWHVGPMAVTVLAGAVLALVVVGPLLAPGFVLVYDMVFVPHPHFSADLLGLTPAYHRTVPTQAVVTVMSAVIGGQAVQKIVLVGIFALAAIGAGRAAPVQHAAARVGAGVLYAWNPFTYERLLLGQWALLLGYALMPWALRSALDWRRGTPGAGPRLVLWMAALTAASPYTGIIGATTAIAAALWPQRDGTRSESGPRARWPAATLVVGLVVVSLPWVVPALLHGSAPDRPRLAVELFRARSDSPVGTVGSLLSLGGAWRTDLAPPGRDSLIWIPAFLLIGGLAAAGWAGLRRASAGWRRGLAAAALVGLVLAAAPSLPLLAGVMRWVGASVPGAGILRDSQKFVLPWAAVLALSFGSGIDAALERAPRSGAAARGLALVLPVLPMALAPTLAWGAGNRLHPVDYPASWAAVERVTSADPTPGGMLVLPWHAYVRFRWNPTATVHQPASLYFGRRVVASTSLEVGTVALPGEDPWSRLLDGAVEAGRPLAPSLRGLGIRYVLVFPEGELAADRTLVRGLPAVLRTPDLTLYRSEPPTRVPRFDRPPVVPVVGADGLAAATVVVAGVGAWRARRRAPTAGGTSGDRAANDHANTTRNRGGGPAMLGEDPRSGGPAG